MRRRKPDPAAIKRAQRDADRVRAELGLPADGDAFAQAMDAEIYGSAAVIGQAIADALPGKVRVDPFKGTIEVVRPKKKRNRSR